jgi:chromate reductase
MNKLNVLALIGGISKSSINQHLYNEIVKINISNIVFSNFDISVLPFYSQDLEQNPPSSVIELQNSVKSADGVILITPEYNRSFSGVLKNAIDWCSRPYGKGPWKDKPVSIIGVSGGKTGTIAAQTQLRSVLSFLDAKIMNQPELYLDASFIFKDDGLVEDTISFIQKYIEKFENFILIHNTLL